MYELSKKRHHEIIDVEKKIHELANILGVKTIGSYDPQIAGCEESEFFDGVHPKKTCVRKIMEQIQSG
ncbi:MAG: hypothetical protein EOO43_14305 [Flavobacterium sp.]|nr:MAG: hypothetical protein EOO43_14305 [Flavobacterium sp.]